MHDLGNTGVLSSMSSPRSMKLGAFVHETGQHVAAWRHPGAYAESGTNFAQAADVARTAERGKFDLFFLADSAAVSVFGSLLLHVMRNITRQ